MEQEPMSLTEIAGRRVREIRRRHDLSAQAVADRCAELGSPEIRRQVVANLETGRRESLTIDQLGVLALALEVPPSLLLLPPEGADAEVAGKVRMSAYRLLGWLSGEDPPPDGHRRWVELAAPVHAYRAWRECMTDVVRLGLRADAMQDSGHPDAEQVRRSWELQVRELAKLTDGLIVQGQTPPKVRSDWLALMRERGWLTYPERVTSWEGDAGASGG